MIQTQTHIRIMKYIDIHFWTMTKCEDTYQFNRIYNGMDERHFSHSNTISMWIFASLFWIESKCERVHSKKKNCLCLKGTFQLCSSRSRSRSISGRIDCYAKKKRDTLQHNLRIKAQIHGPWFNQNAKALFPTKSNILFVIYLRKFSTR